jgi:hypothetical protein
MPTARAALPTDPIADSARMKLAWVAGVQPSARWRCRGTGVKAKQVPESSGAGGAVCSIWQYEARQKKVGKRFLGAWE